MTTNLFGLAAALCVVVAVAGLAGPLWALLLLGVLLGGMTWVSHQNDDTAAVVTAEVARAMVAHAKAAELDKALALSEAAAKAAFELDTAVATERAKTDAGGITLDPELLKGLETWDGRPVLEAVRGLLVPADGELITINRSYLDGLAVAEVGGPVGSGPGGRYTRDFLDVYRERERQTLGSS